MTATDGPRPLGEGISRTTKAGASLFAMELTFRGSRPMRCTVQALNWWQAETFARNRHPDLVEIVRLSALPSQDSADVWPTHRSERGTKENAKPLSSSTT